MVAKKCLLYYMAWEAVVVVLLFLRAAVMAGCPKCSLERELVVQPLAKLSIEWHH